MKDKTSVSKVPSGGGGEEGARPLYSKNETLWLHPDYLQRCAALFVGCFQEAVELRCNTVTTKHQAPLYAPVYLKVFPRVL